MKIKHLTRKPFLPTLRVTISHFNCMCRKPTTRSFLIALRAKKRHTLRIMNFCIHKFRLKMLVVIKTKPANYTSKTASLPYFALYLFWNVTRQAMPVFSFHSRTTKIEMILTLPDHFSIVWLTYGKPTPSGWAFTLRLHLLLRCCWICTAFLTWLVASGACIPVVIGVRAAFVAAFRADDKAAITKSHWAAG